MRFGYLYNFGITSSPTHHYQYDDVGNRTSVLDLGVTKSYGANSVNAYTSISGFAAPVHDANGNMNSGPLGVVGAATSALTYGKENNNLLAASGTQATNFVYDAMGRLVQLSYTVNSVTKTEILTWAGWTLMTREIFSGNAVSETHRYTWGTDLSGTMEGAGGVGGLLAIERNVAGSNTWDIRYTHADANGNIIALTNSSGAVSARYRYDAFGKVLSATDVDASGWVNHNIHGFSSKPTFGGTGLLYYGYRWYSPSLGRWINRDPIEERGGLNLYGFVGSDGVGKWDVLGLAGYGNRYGLPEAFWNWYHRQYKCKGDSDIDKDGAKELYDEWLEEGKPNPEGSRTVPPKEVTDDDPDAEPEPEVTDSSVPHTTTPYMMLAIVWIGNSTQKAADKVSEIEWPIFTPPVPSYPTLSPNPLPRWRIIVW